MASECSVVVNTKYISPEVSRQQKNVVLSSHLCLIKVGAPLAWQGAKLLTHHKPVVSF